MFASWRKLRSGPKVHFETRRQDKKYFSLRNKFRQTNEPQNLIYLAFLHLLAEASYNNHNYIFYL